VAAARSAAHAVVEDLFRREFAHLVAALTRLLGTSHLALAEDVVQDALLSAMHAWQFEVPQDPKAWILQTAKNRAIDVIRRDRRLTSLLQAHDSMWTPAEAVEAAFAPAEDVSNQLAMMLSICDEKLSQETHVTLILRLLCGLSPTEIARAYLVDTQTIDRRLHRGRARLRELGRLYDVSDRQAARGREDSVLQALYLLFNEGYHSSDPDNPLHPAMCADAIRLVELLLESRSTERSEVHALAALFCFNAARLATRLDDDGVFVPLAEQDRARWDRPLIERGVIHLAEAAAGSRLTPWHLEAGIACEHATARATDATNWSRIVELYDSLLALAPSPVVELNRAVAVAELRGPEAGRDALQRVADNPKLSSYSFLWAALADIERRAGRPSLARTFYDRAITFAKSRAERLGYERKLNLLKN
jgi:RNA polymerase sigma-70 factor (ECF subfamily)